MNNLGKLYSDVMSDMEKEQKVRDNDLKKAYNNEVSWVLINHNTSITIYPFTQSWEDYHRYDERYPEYYQIVSDKNFTKELKQIKDELRKLHKKERKLKEKYFNLSRDNLSKNKEMD